MGLGAFINQQKGIVGLLAVIIIVISLGSMLKGGKRQKIDIDRITSMGQFSGEAVAAHLGSGKNVVLVTIDESKIAALEKQTDAFVSALKKGGVSVGDTETVGTQNAPMMAMEMGLISGPELAEIAGRHTDKDAVVSLVGLPYATGLEQWSWPEGAPPLVIGRNAGLSMGAKELFDGGVLDMGVFPKNMVEPVTEKPQTYREWFDRYFQIVTAETADSLAF
jgi:hypothetical protein